MKRKHFILAVLLVLLICAVPGCGSKASVASPTPSAAETSSEGTTATSPATTAEATEPSSVATNEQAATAGMDGFVLPDPTIRPVGVMIDNQGSRPLPQAGIRQAQIVYEVLTEYQITRYFALFWGTMPEMIGPVRSSRHYFLDFAMEYDAVYTHFGWSPLAMSDISKLKINNINGLVNGDAFWDTDTNKANWQDSFTSGERIGAQIEKLKYSTEPKKTFPFSYHDSFTVPADGAAANSVDITFGKGSTCGYTYDAKTGLYPKTRLGEPLIERNTKLQTAPGNVIIQITSCKRIEGDREGRIDVKTVGSGKGWHITGGKARPVLWSKSARNEQTVFTYEDGSPVALNPAQTWIEIVPSADAVVIR